MDQKQIGWMLLGFSIILIVVLGFVKSSIDEQSSFLCEAIDADPNLDMSDCPAHKNNTISWLMIVAFGISFVILFTGAYLSFVPIKSTIKHKFKKSKLDAPERKIYDLLEEKGSMYQSDLVKETGYSKVKLTRILDKMEQKDILEKKRRGMTNIVVLK